jgi:hypothetical protein
MDQNLFFIAQNFQKLNDLDSVIFRSLGTNWGGLNVSGLNLTKGAIHNIYYPAVYDQWTGDLITPAYDTTFFSDTVNSTYVRKNNINYPNVEEYDNLLLGILKILGVWDLKAIFDALKIQVLMSTFLYLQVQG